MSKKRRKKITKLKSLLRGYAQHDVDQAEKFCRQHGPHKLLELLGVNDDDEA